MTFFLTFFCHDDLIQSRFCKKKFGLEEKVLDVMVIVLEKENKVVGVA